MISILSKKDNLSVYFFFILYLIVGLFIYKDFGLSFDEEVHRENGFISFKYILDFFSIKYDFANIVPIISGEIPDINTDWRKTYGVAFDLPMVFLEIFSNLEDTKEVYELRHLFTFLIFFSSCVCFYYLLRLNFENKFFCLLGICFLILSPRIFAQSFYNSRDIVFLSLIIFSTYFSLKVLNENKVKYILLAALFSSLATNTRVLGCYIPFLTIFFYFFETKNSKILIDTLKFSSIYLFFYVFVLYITWPYLWEDPLTNFINAFTEFSKYPYNPYILYLGEYIKANFVPWHYFFVWFLITTPIIFTFFIIIGLFTILKKTIINFINLKAKNNFLLWRTKNEMNELYVLSVFFVPIALVIFLDSTLYTGWRHLYFVYPPLAFIAAKGLSEIINISSKKIKIFIYGCLLFQIIFVLNFLVKSHPVQAVYFNYISKNLVADSFFYDYWGVGNKVTLEKLIAEYYHDGPIMISASSFTDLNKTKLIMNKNDRKKFIYLGIDKKKGDFIFTNYYYNLPPDSDSKYLIPKGYKSIIKLKIGGLLINEIYKKK